MLTNLFQKATDNFDEIKKIKEALGLLNRPIHWRSQLIPIKKSPTNMVTWGAEDAFDTDRPLSSTTK